MKVNNKDIKSKYGFLYIHNFLVIANDLINWYNIGYMLVYFLKGGLPWQHQKANNKQEKYHKIMDCKMSTPIEIICRGLPMEFSNFMNYIKSQKFEDRPDYGYLKRQFRDLFMKEGHILDHEFDWCLEENSTKSMDSILSQKNKQPSQKIFFKIS